VSWGLQPAIAHTPEAANGAARVVTQAGAQGALRIAPAADTAVARRLVLAQALTPELTAGARCRCWLISCARLG